MVVFDVVYRFDCGELERFIQLGIFECYGAFLGVEGYCYFLVFAEEK